MSAMQPKPRPRAIFPASQPATRPRRSQETTPCVWNQTPMVCCESRFAASMKPPKEHQIVSEWLRLLRSRLLLGHAVERAESEYQIAAGNAKHFAVWKQARERIQRDAI